MKNLAKKRLRTVAAFILWGVVIGAALGLIIGQFDERQLFFSGVRGVAIGILIGIGLGVGEEFILPRWSRTMAFARLSVVRIGGYTLLMITALTAVNSVDESIMHGLGPFDSVAFYVAGGLWRDLSFAVVASFLMTGFLQVRKLHNPKGGDPPSPHWAVSLSGGRSPHLPVCRCRRLHWNRRTSGPYGLQQLPERLFFRHLRSDSRLEGGGVSARGRLRARDLADA